MPRDIDIGWPTTESTGGITSLTDVDASDLPTSDPHEAGKLFIDAGGTIQVSAG